MSEIEIRKLKIEEKDIDVYASVFQDIASSVNQNPGAEIVNWIKNVDNFMVSYDGGEMVGFVGYAFLDEEIVYVSTAMVRKNYQKRKLGSRMVTQVIKDFILFRFFHFFRYNIGALRNFYVFFRTQNPSVYKGFYEKTEVNPRPGELINVPERVLRKVEKHAKRLWPSASLDTKELVLHDAYTRTPSLALDPVNVPWTGKSFIDNFFKEKIGLDKVSTSAMLVISKVKLSRILKRVWTSHL